MNKRWIAVAIVLMAGGYWGSAHLSKPKASLPTLTAQLGQIEKQAIAVGQIVPAHSVSIKSQIEGIVGEIFHHVGAHVNAGTPLIKITPNPTPQALTEATTMLMQSEASLESAKQNVTNLERLVKQNIIPKNYGDYIQAQADLKSKLADVVQKRQNLELIRSGEASIGDAKLTSTLTAPIDGTILNLKVEVGEPIISTASSQAATELMSIADMKNMIFKGSVSEHDAAQLAVGMPVTVILAPFPTLNIEGVLSKVAVQSEKLNNTSSSNNTGFDNGFEVEISQLNFPEDITLRSGFSATAHIILEKVENVVTVPERALRFQGNQAEVLIADDSEYGFTAQPVTLGLSDGINVQIISGLENQQTIVDNSMLGHSYAN
ncbi:efflux RND transporter periplasmic adaptor subunit [Vibrio metschnikovii]|jgi:HlyD family secretion protein|uniref:Efflux RND transporter periplasmic adaptor subunit n=2 Tax=Bacteria TaxID=2 RepID=A0A9X0RD58_VIBME|nr:MULTISPECIES: efflux RND transporter periplasmic adaptor subunit [Vibrio]EKO3557634.1 efflux RND transporter periplasmic adaptor subunit [Vibrio metschnikovii]EKO3574935.1 efflux RND transporter periplasmic adaptor subunit [Vibrio metschnikovii]EKO3585695.1 efflux RND transporter periplasmic adaptor subunit [Vibrio metschnikovii]EKO3592957.1 efflux RND transporter periplasmic adaptor subunit [Vibrio metschnikovii]EKO3596690.1 efflux RND transporter periplasmic adaptor subunit [Vibrio metsch